MGESTATVAVTALNAALAVTIATVVTLDVPATTGLLVGAAAVGAVFALLWAMDR